MAFARENFAGVPLVDLLAAEIEGTPAPGAPGAGAQVVPAVGAAAEKQR